MHIQTKHLYTGASHWHFSVFPKMPRHIIAILVVLSFLAPLHAIGTDPSALYEQEFVITAYYSPEPGQCCYVKGGLRADKVLNGEGHTTADGSSVYPGVIAAPSQYAFGTRVALPGIGTFTVHDRGGAINVLPDGRYRLDIWAGYGEEGLARALAFGVQRVKGTVYPVGSAQPLEEVALESLPAPFEKLRPFLLPGTDVLAVTPQEGDRGLSVWILQERLREAGYFDRAPTGFFALETKESLRRFIVDFGLEELSDRLTQKTAAFLLAAAKRRSAGLPIRDFVDQESSEDVVVQAKRILRFLGYYRGRTPGPYDDKLFQAILAFQQRHGLVGDAASPGAGRIGPMTNRVLVAEWNRVLVADRAELYLALRQIEQHLEEQGKQLARFLEEGDGGPDVRLLQSLLAERGFFPAEKINGSFGPLTRQAVLGFQRARGIIVSAEETGAGTVGPETLAQLRHEEKIELYKLVRAEGWRAL